MNRIARIIAILAAVSGAALLPQFFIYQNVIFRWLIDVFPLKVDERYTGGPIQARFLDPFGDDAGEGGLTYPLHPSWEAEGTLDLLRYTVHEPVTEGKWASQRVFWQLDLTFAALENPLEAPLGFSHPSIHLYLDIDGAAGGSTESRIPRSELVRFSEEAPWDFCIEVNGFSPEGRLFSVDGEYETGFPVYLSRGENTIILRLPLEEGGLLPVLAGNPSRHYLLVGGFSQLGQGNYLSVQTGRAGVSSGGGASGRMTPRVFDYLAPRGTTQQEILSNYDASSRVYAELIPVVVDPAAEASVWSEEDLAVLKAAAEKEASESLAETQAPETAGKILTRGLDPGAEVAALFGAGYIDEAEEAARKHLEQDSEQGEVLAYYGSIRAIRGGESSDIGASVAAVEEAFALYEEALGYLETEEDRLHVYLNRGNVALSIPENVFGYSALGAGDFTAAGEYFLSIEDNQQAGDCFYQAGLCLKRAGQGGRAELTFARAAALEGISSSVRYELALRGF